MEFKLFKSRDLCLRLPNSNLIAIKFIPNMTKTVTYIFKLYYEAATKMCKSTNVHV